jgi:hypothetical protein
MIGKNPNHATNLAPYNPRRGNIESVSPEKKLQVNDFLFISTAHFRLAPRIRAGSTAGAIRNGMPKLRTPQESQLLV